MVHHDLCHNPPNGHTHPLALFLNERTSKSNWADGICLIHIISKSSTKYHILIKSILDCRIVISRLFQKRCSSGAVSTSLSRTIIDFMGFSGIFFITVSQSPIINYLSLNFLCLAGIYRLQFHAFPSKSKLIPVTALNSFFFISNILPIFHPSTLPPHHTHPEMQCPLHIQSPFDNSSTDSALLHFS